MADGLPTDEVLRELEARHDDVLKQITELDERLSRVLAEYSGTRKERVPERVTERASDQEPKRLGEIAAETIAEPAVEPIPDIAKAA